ncbi:hypothetical protein ACLGL1_02380 [Peptococcus simiae]|uniref:hypothetical protein n=1 Tax=Peptococcus simiae TaxID=1643805 RepID=UPI00397F58AE
MNYVRFFNIDFHRDVYAFLEEFLERFHPQYRHRAKHLTYTVYTLWPNLLPQLINGLPSYKALVVSHYDHYYAQIIKNLINSIDTNMLEAEVYEGCEITTDILREVPHEVIITDFVVREKLENKIIFSFEQLPMPQKMEKLIKTICLDQIRRILEEHPGEFTDYRHDSGLE